MMLEVNTEYCQKHQITGPGISLEAQMTSLSKQFQRPTHKVAISHHQLKST